MAVLLDTNVLVRLTNTADASHSAAVRAVVELHRRGEVLQVTAQVLVEFWAVATRPAGANGLGLPAAEAEARVAGFEASFGRLEESPAVYPAWRSLVAGLGVVGKQVHDARLVAVCHAHGVTHVLTFNVAHFTRLAGFGPGVVVLDPASL